MAGRRSWVSDRRGGGMEEEGEEEVEESAMLEPLGQSRYVSMLMDALLVVWEGVVEGNGKAPTSWSEEEESCPLWWICSLSFSCPASPSSLARCWNLYIAVGSFSFFIMLYIIVASVASSGWEAANSMCQVSRRFFQRLGGDMTPENRMEDWVPFISAVSKIYLQLGRSKLPDVNLLDVAKKCAASGWKDDCGKEIERERELLRTEFDKHAARWRPVGQELRLPAGFSLEYKKEQEQEQEQEEVVVVVDQ
ncbi:hypothetical protein GUITHDRAFT_134792 [Guillardia theta CCMP2712]|uniref:Uncharacterized protein n=1 Tax=Guillardia theta (strain CCMP2712) TaxID=905079 RepID=L1JSA9_GUITC|nr:hypothetical protein GUITHDRAFT_134792 [Guillardia theta CCMP2712]EKX51317.1 hypothetical protein GUITHDRAFT_134792 [Guillardia theta CCMP2712]|eukprot:XP_005838297.1 hypothetical protein GUITHDRAFT_134792 [Guillardia theta CCMP2712]